ncbi:MAG: GIY-YIG nuclease family protein [Acidobacteriota bacterium]
MSNPGFIYLLMNPSMEGLVKIGKTTRDPKERAKELSATTGIPTPFVLVFDAYFDDHSRAEEYIHALLQQRGYRISMNREFFSIPVNEAIKAILDTQKMFENQDGLPLGKQADPHNFSDLTDFHKNNAEPWLDVFGMAEDAHYGLRDTLEDVDEALRLYLHANRLGAPKACLRIGQIYKDNERLQNPNQALVYFKEGVKRGLGECYAEMASIFFDGNELDNFRKCWAMYFESDSFSGCTHDRALYAYTYLFQTKHHRLPLDHRTELFRLRDEILKIEEESLDRAGKKHRGAHDGDLRFIRYTLFPEIQREIGKGPVISLDRERGSGLIENADGKELFVFWLSDVIDEPLLLRAGQRVEFEIADGRDGRWACNVILAVESPKPL